MSYKPFLYINEWAGTFLVLAAFDTLYSKAALQFVCGSADPFPVGSCSARASVFFIIDLTFSLWDKLLAGYIWPPLLASFIQNHSGDTKFLIDFISPTIKWPKACLQRISSRMDCTVSNHETCSPNLGFFNRLPVCQTIYLVV